MSIFDWLFDLFRARPTLTPEDVADRLERFAGRFQNAGDVEAAQAARSAAAEARVALDITAAVRIEQAFLQSRGLGPDGRPPRPILGQADGGPSYVRYGNQARTGGSLSWRYNNPGYVRCSSRSTSYGAIGCDGQYAIFPDERTGHRAFVESLKDEYPDRPLGEALKQHLPPEANPNAVCDSLQKSGYDLGMVLGTLTREQLDSAASACTETSGWESGEIHDRHSGGPSWTDDMWSDNPGTSDSTVSQRDTAPATDNS